MCDRDCESPERAFLQVQSDFNSILNVYTFIYIVKFDSVEISHSENDRSKGQPCECISY